MLGSLVVVFPTRHEGGALVFRHGGREFKFDSAEAVSESKNPCVAYAAFYGDIEHEVELVLSGYRVTLTYNLYLEDSESVTKGPKVPGSTAYEQALKAAFRTLIQDQEYLPEGGYIGFGLRHEYPLDLSSRERRSEKSLTSLKSVPGRLKGIDAILAKVCNDLSLKAYLKMVYYGEEKGIVMCPNAVLLREGEFHDEQSVEDYLVRNAGAQ